MGDSKIIIDDRIPSSVYERKRISDQIISFVGYKSITPPMPMDRLRELANEFISTNGHDPVITDWVMVMMNNALWRSKVASIPYEKRVLLLPQCLKNSTSCTAPFDEFGLLCQCCGLCPINPLESKADQLGMMTIVSDGYSTVVSLIETGQIEAVIGVACLESLEKIFGRMVEHAIPGIAIPLTKAGCVDTTVDLEMVTEAIELKSSNSARNRDIESIKTEINGWLALPSLNKSMGIPKSNTEKIAQEWLAGNGNRWRPLLLAATYNAISGEEAFPEKVKIAALAVECFHKASLVHDDIEDSDDFRYGAETLHKRFGVAMAINIGDMLLGQGYDLLMDKVFGDNDRSILLQVATRAHKDLCSGQGLDLEWGQKIDKLDIETIIEIARLKTVPAFKVAIDYGAILAGASEKVMEQLQHFSLLLGIAYQLKDDLEDLEYPANLHNKMKEAYTRYREEVSVLVDKVENPNLKMFLYRLTIKMLGD